MNLIQNIDYNIQGYHKKMTFDANGDLILVEYYKNYDGTTYSKLVVRETRTYTRDVVFGLLTERDMVIEFFNNRGGVEYTKTTKKYYDAKKGYNGNKQARTNIIDTASMYLLSVVGLQDGKAFLRIVKSEISGYISGDSQPLLDAVANSTELYMTGVIKTALDTILNVTY